MKFLAEHTDTFGNEANYSWVRREYFEAPADATDRQLVRLGKKALGLTGVRCTRSTLGELIELRPHGSCTVVFISHCEEEWNE